MIVLRNKTYSFLPGSLSWGRFVKSIGANLATAWEKTKAQIDNIKSLAKGRRTTLKGLNIFRKACQNRFKKMDSLKA